MLASDYSQHNESIASGVNRSTASVGSVGSVGDTKSIVLALQALQEKIRKLEQDRNFHQEQCEAAREAHDAYKREVEVQLENERRTHRQREMELQELIDRANQERARLQGTLEESKSDISTFRGELEQLLERERSTSKEREDQLRSEIENYRQQIQRERRSQEEMQATIEQTKTEREIVLSTNRRLESTIKDLIAMNNGLMSKTKQGGSLPTRAVTGRGGQQGLRATQPGPRGASVGAKTRTRPAEQLHVDPMSGGNASAIVPPAASANVSRDSIGSRGRPGTPQRRSSSAAVDNSRYRSPTHSSQLKCTRCESHGILDDSTMPPKAQQTLRTASTSGRPAQRSASAAGARRGPAAGAVNQSIGQAESDALDEVYEGLVREHRELNKKYKETIEQANAPGSNVTPEVLTATLNAIMAQIDRKAEQMRLMRNSKAELVGGTRGVGAHRALGPKPMPRGADKMAKKGALVNELRALFARATHQ